MNRPLTALVIAGAVSLAACGGGGGGSAAPVPKAAPSGGVGTLAFSIVVPAKPAPSSLRRKPAYVSPATQSVTFSVGGSTPQVVTLSLGSSNCPLTSGGYICTADASVPAGANQSLTIKTYASTDGTGPVLSMNTAIVSIVAGQTNPETVSLNGVAATLSLNAPGPPTITKCSPTSFIAMWAAYDAAGYQIIGPGTIVAADGTPVAPTLTTSDTTRFTVSAPSNNVWTIAYNGAGGGSSVTLTASNPGVTSATRQLPLTPGSLLFYTTGANSVSMLQPPYSGTPATITNSVLGPTGLLVDSSCNLFVANYGSGGTNTVTEYAPPYTGAPTATIASTDAYGLAMSAAGNLFVLSTSPTNKIFEYAPPYTGAPIATIVFGLPSGPTVTPDNVSLDAAGDAFVVLTTNGVNFLRVYAPPYTGTPTSVNVTNPQVTVVQSGSNDLFVTNNTAAQVFAPPYSGTAIASVIPGSNSGSFGLALDPAGDFFVAYSSSDTVVEYTAPYTATPAATVSSGVNTPVNVVIDPATSNLFVANLPFSRLSFVPHTVTVYAPPYTAAPFATVNATASNGALAVSP